MAEHESVPLDTANQVIELAESGLGRNQISVITGINASTVRRIIQGKHQSYCNTLSIRQVQSMINQCFRPNNLQPSKEDS